MQTIVEIIVKIDQKSLEVTIRIYKLKKGENYSQRLVLSLGTLLNAISLFIFGCVLPWMNCTSFYIWVLVWVSF